MEPRNSLESLKKANITLLPEVMLPNKVMSEEEAKRMTDNDKTGRVWSVGDEYFMLRISREDYEKICRDDQLWC